MPLDITLGNQPTYVEMIHREIALKALQSKIASLSIVLADLDESTYSPSFVVGILDSDLMHFYRESSFSTLNEQKNHGASLSIRRINFADPAQQSLHDGIAHLVEKMEVLHHERQELHPEDDLDCIRAVDRQLRHTRELMNYLVYELYGLTEEEILMIAGFRQDRQDLQQILPFRWQLVGDSVRGSPLYG